MRITMREDQQLNPVKHLAENYAPNIVRPAMAFANACYTKSQLSLREFEGARMRTAQINGCELCRGFRAARDLPEMFGQVHGVVENGPEPEEAFYAAVADFRTSELFSERERLAIDYAERMGLDPQRLARDERFWALLKGAFSEDEIVDLTYCIGAWIGLGRAVHVLGLDQACSMTTAAVS